MGEHEVLTAVAVMSTAFCAVTPFISETSRRFGGTFVSQKRRISRLRGVTILKTSLSKEVLNGYEGNLLIFDAVWFGTNILEVISAFLFYSKDEAPDSPVPLVYLYQTTRRQILEYRNLRINAVRMSDVTRLLS